MEDAEIKFIQGSGCVIFKKERKLHIMQQLKRWLVTTKFIALIISIIALGFGIFQIITFLISPHDMIKAGIIFASIGAISSIIFVHLSKMKKKTDNLPLEKLNCICIIDLEKNILLDKNEKILAPLDETRIERIFQVTSSSPALALTYPKGKIKIANGNPFDGGIVQIEKKLKEFINQ